jgi:sec-independent protein translocase protein TatA
MPSWIGPWEIAIVLVLALLIFGPKKLPDLGSSLGRSITGFRKGLKETKDDVQSAIKEDVSAETTSTADTAAASTAAASTAEAGPAAASTAETGSAATDTATTSTATTETAVDDTAVKSETTAQS